MKFSYQKRGNSYRTQIRIEGKQISLTAPSVAELKQKVAEARTSEPDIIGKKVSFEQAYNSMMKAKSNVYSVNTIAGYKQMYRQCEKLYNKNVFDITSAAIQAFMNEYAATHSPHSCTNLMSFINVVVKFVRNVRFDVKLPQKKEADLPYPTEEEIKELLCTKNIPLKRGLLICLFSPARRGEACAIKYKDIEGNVLHIHATMAKDTEWVYKDTPKNSHSDRYVTLPDNIIKELGSGNPDDYVVGLTPQALYNRYRRALKSMGIQHYRLHATRVFGASYFHMMGISDAQLQKRGGWSSDTCMKKAYRKSLRGDENVSELVSDFMKK